MDKFEYQAKLEEIGKLVDTGDYEGAAQIADSIDWKRVRSVRTLCTISEIYEEVGRVEDSKAILSRAYRRSPNSRQILYRLSEACVLTQDFDDAVEYYTEYVNLSPNDSNKYLLKYKIYKGRGSSIEEQIKVLEDLKAAEYSERWAYELCCLYDQAGMQGKCVEECNDLALWFHSGKYVVEALKLKQKYEPLTPQQKAICDNPIPIEPVETEEEDADILEAAMNTEIKNELPVSETDAIADSILMNTEKEIAAAITEQKEAEKAEKKKKGKKYDAMNLQAELANSMRQILSGLKGNRAAEKEAVEEIVEETATEEAVAEEVVEEIVEEAAEEATVEEPVEEITDAVTEEAAEEIADAVTEEVAEEIVDEEPVEEEVEEEAAVEEESETADMEKPEEIAEEAEEASEVIREVDSLEAFEDVIKPLEVKLPDAPVVTADDLMTAATINLGETIRKEIGELSLREYAAAKAARKAEEEKLTRKIILEEVPVIKQEPALDIPDVPEIKIPTLDMPEMPVMNMRKETPAAKEEESVEVVEQVSEEKAEDIEEIPEAVEEEATTLEAAEALVEELEEANEVKIDPMSYVRSGLDEKEKSMLGFWGGINGICDQIDSAVTRIMRSSLKDKTSSSGNVILVGNAGNGRTSLAISLAKIVGRCKGQQNAKVAKIYAEDLNNKDIAQVVNKISGGVLIIEEAGDMSDNTIAQLSMAMDFKTDSLVVFLEDEKTFLQELLARNPKFAQKFDITINVPILTNEELLKFAQYYALQHESVIAENALPVLQKAFVSLQTPEQPLAMLDVKELMDKAIKRANKFSVGKMFSTLSGKRYDEENRIIIFANAFKKLV